MTLLSDAPAPVGHPRPTGAAARMRRAARTARRARPAPITAFWLLIVAILVLPILLFLLVAFSPRLLDQGPQWFTLTSFSQALQGPLLVGLRNSLIVGSCSAVLAAALGFGVAWVVLRTDLPGRRLWSGSMFALLLAPSYLIALGWERLLEPSGVLDVFGFHSGVPRDIFYGPVGIIAVLTVKGLPFAYLAISSALRGLGSEFEAAARVHGSGTLAATRVVVSLLAPAMWSALAIVFAESVSDFGVASTLANDSHFPVATFVLYDAVDNFPVNFPVAAAVGWALMAMAGLALLAQSRALRGRSYRVLGGRSRPARRHRLRLMPRLASIAVMTALVVLALGVPVFGAVSASLLSGLGSFAESHSVTLTNYQRALSSPDLRGPLLYSASLATITATITVLLGVVSARLLTERGGKFSARLLDMLLLAAVALPGIVFAAGYIFTYNLPLVNSVGVHLYETTTLLVLGYLATALPSTARVLTGSVGQIQHSLREAARVHGIGAIGSWARAVLPVLMRPLIAAWTLTFAATLLELPVSELLYPPDHPPVSVGITKELSTYDFGGGTAMEVVAVLVALVVVAAAFGVFRLLAPAGWRRIGSTS
ncbi:MAG TPA: iron ABC transporter permease [Jatrophihabitantaceae bacterium]|jgi:iron(III) transport system permease protein|nr:iron ABC transporter permease [Jatrophihabitantaceae bacterium]